MRSPWERGPVGGETAYMENVCASADAGWGVELDWLRTFWDYHTDSHSGSSKPSHKVIMEQMARAHDWMRRPDVSDGNRRAYEAMLDHGRPDPDPDPEFRARFRSDAEKNSANDECPAQRSIFTESGADRVFSGRHAETSGRKVLVYLPPSR